MAQPLRIYHTLRPLKWSQIWYRMVQPLQKKYVSLCKVVTSEIVGAMKLPVGSLKDLLAYKRYDPANRTFTFLNRTAAFPDKIDWNYAEHGALWAYNLNYFEWLYDETISTQLRYDTIKEYGKADLIIGLDSYPTSLRIMAWARFLLKAGYRDVEVISQLFQHADRLYSFPEYHLDGNHLWENAMALVCAGVFFRNELFYQKGKTLILQCMQEQLCNDGGHVEGSPMYHSLLLWRLLQCIELLDSIGKKDGLKAILEEHACKMLSWLNNMTFSDGTWPAINDSTDGIAPGTEELLDYAMQLGLRRKMAGLSDSGYRMIHCGDFELFIDAAPIMPAFQPGHSHADIGTFCLHYRGKPVIVDTGISTYEDGELRHRQRSTPAHNTLNIDGCNSSDVWKSFRVGRRAQFVEIIETDCSLTLSYCGYAHPRIVHKRIFNWQEQEITIIDELSGDTNEEVATIMIFFHPGNPVKEIEANLIKTEHILIQHEGISLVQRVGYDFCNGFNITLYSEAIQAKMSNTNHLSTLRIKGNSL